MIRTARLMLLVVAVPVALGACRKKPPVVTPVPAAQPQPEPERPRPVPTNNTPTAPDTMADHNRRMAEARDALTRIIYFDYDSDELTAEARSALDARIPLMNANPGMRIRISGHCDERGTDEYNLVLGRRRAEQAKRYLVDRGVDASRIETMSFGRERPAVTGTGEDAWSRNRRDEFDITAGGENLRLPR